MAKDVITRFRLETNQYDSALRDSTSKLKDFSKMAALAGKDFDRFTQSNIEAARALGTAATGATNAKDKVKELVSSYNSLANTYNSLSAIQKQSDFAKAMAESLTTLQGRIKDAKQELYGLSDTMKGIGTGGGFLSGIGDKMGGMLQVFGGNLMTQAAGWAMQQVGEMQELVKQSIEVARAAEGIKNAYDRLNQPDLLKNLKEATHGTVSELELMKAAVKFNDFNLPLEELGTMLAFAQQKAKDTGQSVDYMVDSIVTGLGRKSLMILDNLGLSATEIRDKMKETGDMTKAVGEIIREKMAQAGDYVETAADRAAKANADLEDAMLRLGETFKPLTDSASSMWNNIKIGALDLLNNVIKPLIDSMTEAGRLRREIENFNNPKKEGGKTHSQDVLDRLREYSGDKQGLYKRQLAQYDTTENTAWRNYNRLKEQKESFRQEAMRRGARESDIDTFNDFDKQIEKARNQALAIQKLRADYIAGAKDILNPTTPTAPTTPTNPTTPTGMPRTTTTAVKTALTEEEKVAKALAEAERKRAEQLNNLNEAGLNAVRDNNLGQAFKVQREGLNMGLGAELTQIPVTFTYSQDNMAALMSSIKADLSASELGSDMFNALTEQLSDASSLSNLISYAMKNGIEASDLSEASNVLFQQLLGEGDIPDEALESLKNAIGETLGKSLNLSEDGGLSENKKDDYDSWKGFQKSIGNLSTAMSGLTTITSGLQAIGIKIDGDFANFLSGLQGAISIIQGVITIINALSVPAETANTVATYANTAAIGSLAAALHSNTISRWIKPWAEGGVVHAAMGITVPGNNFSGDLVPAMVNSGELILNRAQQGNLLAQMEGGGMQNLHLDTEVSGENLRIILRNNNERHGYGEVFTFNM